MIYTVSIKCIWGAYFEEPFERTIEVPDDITLGELHDVMQDLTGFDRDHLFTFFVARGPKGKRVQVVETEDWEDRQGCLYEIPLKQVVPLPANMKLFYLFDFGDDWTFQISTRRKLKPEELGAKYPRIVKATGPKPVQYPSFE
ncbi:MAG TPA: hypothetical protein DCP92_12540 [Nitrospiraceae bacterium]|nr:hypothetical protein [Nitrospiraceae bacterium]